MGLLTLSAVGIISDCLELYTKNYSNKLKKIYINYIYNK